MSEDQMQPNEETTTEEPKAEEPGPKWEYKKEFAVTGQMREVVKMTVAATEAEIQALHRKLEKLQYGG